MVQRFVSIWFPHLRTDWFIRHQPYLKDVPFVLRSPSHGRMIVTGTNIAAEERGITRGSVLADARAVVPGLGVLDDKPDLAERLLKRLAEWCIRFSPSVAVDLPEGLLIDASGCTHLWGGDEAYLSTIKRKFNTLGYDVRLAMADTLGVAWGCAHFSKTPVNIPSGKHTEALMNLPPEALRIEPEAAERLHKLGLHQVRQFISISRPSLRRRFGQHFITRLDMALGYESETIQPLRPIEPFQERLPSMEPIVTATGIEIALKQLLEIMCHRLWQEQKGVRKATFKVYRVDGKIQAVDIGTNRPSCNVNHLFKLFELKLSALEPGLGIELFILEAPVVEEHLPQQEKMWEAGGGWEDTRLAELLDRLAIKVGIKSVIRYLPDEHYWPERSTRQVQSLEDKPIAQWKLEQPRPLQLLKTAEPIEVTAPIPDYPPMLFRYKGKLHEIVKADGPERIEQEWWLEEGLHRDYYRVEDKEGHRYWLFRLGHYTSRIDQWYIHGFFA